MALVLLLLLRGLLLMLMLLVLLLMLLLLLLLVMLMLLMLLVLLLLMRLLLLLMLLVLLVLLVLQNALRHACGKPSCFYVCCARQDVYRFLRNQHLYQYNLETLCTVVYLQGVLDGAQGQAQLGKEGSHDRH